MSPIDVLFGSNSNPELLRELYARQKRRVITAALYCFLGLGLCAFILYEIFKNGKT